MAKKQLFSEGYLKTVSIVLFVLVVALSFVVGMQYGEEADTTISKEIEATAPAEVAAPAADVPPPPSVPTQATPEVELFVMSECPYGLQMQKAYVPVAELLGEKANMKVKWVAYAMHGLEEIEENTRQYCLQEEQESVYLDYLRCYIEKKDSPACQASTNVDTGRLQACVDATNAEFDLLDAYEDKASWLSGRFPVYAINSAENQEYGVRGSPTMVINGKTVSVSRSAEAVKQAVCAAFDKAPEECKTVLNTNQEAPSHGPVGVGSGEAMPTGSC